MSGLRGLSEVSVLEAIVFFQGGFWVLCVLMFLLKGDFGSDVKC